MLTMPGLAMKLTKARIVMIPLFIFLFYVHPDVLGKWPALIVYALACITDYFDGYLARRNKESSPLGAFLDPVADKLMVAAVLIVVLQSRPEWWLMICTLIVIGREIWISALREWMAALNLRNIVAVSNIGKWKTTAQMFALGFLIYQDDFLGFPIWQIGQVLMLIAAVLTVLSMWKYTAAALAYLK
ncbi:CDP-diacylglycerol--glycerol-3-phosphate 3-phosphatidyltransferase [Suttonella sp. R2A3]|uniref:CDP-diacylglycerol--glycerol-3-phosphate 3-phosphatidyltransferase n=1 Tax=Suttonella sp. R2A3 TaxID=2908648 RepID=UPI001F29AA0C|nr:CDP-diacylglycerol--glycerol-3-phosphate 3-phosphatidyltransferase [Suttonella sp. R2A3]UJF24311.1 CDP-diacylglycerol--glycerol-3-phosphate 3-phosphatidyltransferase [Suttonella sp. R2A3]